jgi:hypothetical protein
MKRELVFSPAWDRRDPDPKKNYGIHGVEMRFLLSGKVGTVQFVLHTNWQLPSIRGEENSMEKVHRFLIEPMPADIGYHSRVPLWEGQTPTQSILKVEKKKIKIPSLDVPGLEEELDFPNIIRDPEIRGCEFLNNDPCFYDGSTLNAKKYFDILVAEGEEALWNALLNYYHNTLGYEYEYLDKINVFLSPDGDWFYIYRHWNGGWEKSRNFTDFWPAIFSKIKTHLRVYKKKFFKFISSLTQPS